MNFNIFDYKQSLSQISHLLYANRYFVRCCTIAMFSLQPLVKGQTPYIRLVTNTYFPKG